MSNSRPDLPEPFVTSPDHVSEVEDFKEEFFQSVLEHLGYGFDSKESERARNVYCSIEYYTLHQYDSLEPVRPTDSKLVLLRVRERVVASVLQWRDDYNYIQVEPALYLTEEVTEQVRFNSDLNDTDVR